MRKKWKNLSAEKNQFGELSRNKLEIMNVSILEPGVYEDGEEEEKKIHSWNNENKNRFKNEKSSIAHERNKNRAILITIDRSLAKKKKKMEKTMHETDETKSQKLWNEKFPMQAKCLQQHFTVCTQFAHEHVPNITEDQSLVSTEFGIQIENNKTAHSMDGP